MGAESQNTGYEGKLGHEKKFHKTHFGAIKQSNGNERVKIKTQDGWTWCSRFVAEDEGLEIISQKRKSGAEAQR